MNTLILSCNTGQGHNSVSKALEEAFSLRGFSCRTVDSLSFISEKASQIIGNWHTALYRYLPKVSDKGYRIAENHPALFEDGSLINSFLVSGSEKLCEYLISGSFDCVICPHVFSALMMTRVRKLHPELKVKTSFIATDYTFAPITAESDCDIYFVPDIALIDLYSSMGIPADKIQVITGIPVRRSFYQSKPKDDAKKELSIPCGYKHIVMMFGSMGCGPIAKLTGELKKLMDDKTILTVICGTNEMLHKLLQLYYKDSENIRIEGFVKDISLVMDSADIYITKPGGLSISEARIKHLPMVLVNAVAGCEQNNLEFLLEKGAAITGDTEEEIANLTVELLKNEQRLKEIAEVFKDTKIAADEVFEAMK